MLIKRWFFLALIVVSLLITVACQQTPSLTKTEQTELMFALLTQDPALGQATLSAIRDSGDPALIWPLIDIYWAGQIGINDWSGTAEMVQALEALSGEAVGDDWVDWVNFGSQNELGTPTDYIQWKGMLFNELDPAFSDFFAKPIQIEVNFRPEEIVWGGVLKDGIPALNQLAQVPISEAKGYTPKDAVFGLSINGDSRAYPLRVMDWHEMANDVVGGVPISIAYCTLCGSAIAYKTEQPDGTAFEFGSSGLLYKSNKLMFDRQTNTLWNQLTGRPVMGPLAGELDSLEILPIVISTLEEWQAQHPDSTILPLETGVFRDYTAGAAYGEYFARDTLLFPVGEIDDRLAPKDQVFALRVKNQQKAYPLVNFVEQPLINDTLGDQNIVLISAQPNINVYGYSYELEYITYSAGGEVRAFDSGDHTYHLSELGQLVDENGGVWQITEEALLGPDQVEQGRIGGHVSFWFGWQSFYPDTAVYGFE